MTVGRFSSKLVMRVHAAGDAERHPGSSLHGPLPGPESPRHVPLSPLRDPLRRGEGAVGGALPAAVRFLARFPDRPRPPLASRPATPALTDEAGPSSSSESTRSTRWCARPAAARWRSSPSSPSTTWSTRSSGISRRRKRGLPAARQARPPSPPPPDSISAAAVCAGRVHGGGGRTEGRGSKRVFLGRALPTAGFCRLGDPSGNASPSWAPNKRLNPVLGCS